ncbi:MAG: hypothetical protein ACYTG5_17595, partial [Planctomycetota bacterium]
MRTQLGQLLTIGEEEAQQVVRCVEVQLTWIRLRTLCNALFVTAHDQITGLDLVYAGSRKT